MKYTSLIYLLLACCVVSCQEKAFDREADLFNYLDKVHHLEVQEAQNIVLLQPNFCGACTWEVIDFLKKELPNIQQKTLLVFSGNNPKIISELDDLNNKNVSVIIDDKNLAGRYGLIYTKDLFFNIKEGAIQYWGKLDDEGLQKIRKKIAKMS